MTQNNDSVFDDQELKSISNYDTLYEAKVKREAEEDSGKKDRGTFITDISSSFINSVANVPDGIATSFMVGVSPIHGLYANVFAPSVSSIVSKSNLMITGPTVAASVATGAAISGFPEEQKLSALFLLTLLIGGFLILFGLLKAGRLMRFISYSVMKGFLYGVGILLILNSIPDLLGYSAQGSNAFVKLWDTFTHFSSWDIPLTGPIIGDVCPYPSAWKDKAFSLFIGNCPTDWVFTGLFFQGRQC